ncbi:hypothetical protein V5799_026071 [Amblyomma americanum]|uniref:Uncharacterized protein n=1 Tax=Amblyomma americanum TaxID=6943 RepID=A0AAQ4DJM3_AMBAM
MRCFIVNFCDILSENIGHSVPATSIYTPSGCISCCITTRSRKAWTSYSEAFHGQANMSNIFAVNLLASVAAMLALLIMAPNGAEAIPPNVMDTIIQALGREEDTASKE